MKPATSPRLTWEEYQELLSYKGKAGRYDALVEAGVDNWIGWDEAMEIYHNQDD